MPRSKSSARARAAATRNAGSPVWMASWVVPVTKVPTGNFTRMAERMTPEAVVTMLRLRDKHGSPDAFRAANLVYGWLDPRVRT